MTIIISPWVRGIGAASSRIEIKLWPGSSSLSVVMGIKETAPGAVLGQAYLSVAKTFFSFPALRSI